MNVSEVADDLIADWLDGKRSNVVSILDCWSPKDSRALLAQFMLRLIDQDPESLPVLIEMLEDELDRRD